MHTSRKSLSSGLLLAAALYAGPREFGRSEFDAALQARGMRPGQIRLRCELGDGPAESWRIEGTRVTGGDLRGLMYGLFEAAAQVRATGRLSPARGSAAMPMRGVRIEWNARTREADQEQWREFVAMLARSRINRLQLVVAEPERHLEFLRNLSTLCANYGVDLTIGLPEDAAEGPAIHERMKKVLGNCPLVRSVHVHVVGDPDAEFYRQWVMRAAEEAGRLVTIELPDAAGVNGRQVRMARPFREDARGGENQYYEIPSPLASGAPVWADPMWVRYIAGIVERSGSLGFEIEAPWPWEPHWAFFLMWGRLGYHPHTADELLAADFERRMGKALGSGAFRAWSAASRAFSLAALLSPGRWVATAEEAERMAREGTGSAKLTPADIAAAVEEAIADAAKALPRLPADDAERIERLLAAARARTAPAEAPAAKRSPKPQVQHFPPRVAPANIAFPLGLIITPPAQVRLVRLHYRVAGEEGDFRTIEAPPARAWFQVKAAGNLTYYFEILSRDNKGWFHPDPLAGAPFFHLPVRERKTEPVNEAEAEAKPATRPTN